MKLVVCTEDSGDAAEQVVAALGSHALRSTADHVEGTDHRTFQRIDKATSTFDAPRGDPRTACCANSWSAKRSPLKDKQRRSLLQYLATQLAQPDTLVLFHFDADARWSDRPAALWADWDQRIRAPLATQLAHDQLARLIPLVPHWESEGWCYGTLARARKLHPKGTWPADDRRMDEVPDPKQGNGPPADALLDAWPRKDVLAEQGSFAHLVLGLAWNPEVRRLLTA